MKIIEHGRTSFGRSAAVAGILVAIALLVTGLLPSSFLLSADDTDLVLQFASARAFATQTWLSGHVPLWNPYTYGGQPFLGGFESAVLYPVNVIFLLMPLTWALNFSLLLHLVILGWGMERWSDRRGLHPLAAALAGVVLPLSGAVFPHLYAGHLSNLCTMAWAPWIFLGLESWVMSGDRRGFFLASAAVCLQILGGHIQYFFYTAVAVGLQALVVSIVQPNLRRRAFPAAVVSYAAGMMLGAAQLLPGWAAFTESLRQQKLPSGLAAQFSLPPENFLTLLAPGFFGGLDHPAYWGRCYFWEMSLFIGAGSLPLIAIACCAPLRRRQAGLDLAVAAILLLLALGSHSPLFRTLYDWAPGFGHFRGWSKFVFPATLFLVMTAASGADSVLRGERSFLRVGWASLGLGVAAGALGWWLIAAPAGIAGMLAAVKSSGESYLNPEVFTQPEFIRQAGFHAGVSLGLGGLALLAAGVALVLAGRWPVLRWVMPGLVVLEMIGSAGGELTLSSVADVVPDNFHRFVAEHPGDYRVVNLLQPNNGFLLRAGDLLGNNPLVPRRYAEFMNFVHGRNPDEATQYLPFEKSDPLDALLRLRYVYEPEGGRIVESPTPPLPHVLLLSDWKMLAGRDAIFAAMREPGFDPAKRVLLESAPAPLPQPGVAGTATLVAESANELRIVADIDKPALLLITDVYARGWHAEALPGSVQQVYTLMPADYILRAVPLAEGHHVLRIVYAPRSFSIGVGISLAAWVVWIWLLAGPSFKRPLRNSRPRLQVH